MELTGSSRLQPRVTGKSYTLACQNPFAEMFREIRWLRKQNHAITGTEGKHSSSVCKCDTADLHAIHRAFDKMQNTLQNISIGVGQRGRGSGVCSALTLLPCKSTSGTKLHQTNNSITSLRTQMDEDTMYNLSLLWRLQVQMRSLITSRLEKLRQKCSANNCRLKSSRQKNFCVGYRGSSPKIIFSRQMRQAAR